MHQFKIAIIGAGVAGLNCARLLSKQGYSVEIFDKGRIAGGRLAARTRTEDQFDYGAQYFSARSVQFRNYLTCLLKAGKVASWNCRFARLDLNSNPRFKIETADRKRYVGVPSMNTLAENLAKDSNIHQLHKICSIKLLNNKWTLSGTKHDGKGEEEQFQKSNFDYLVLNLPPKQAYDLYQLELLESVDVAPCFSFCFSFSETLALPIDAVFIDGPVLSWVARDSSKPGRPEGERWVLHTSSQWSKDNIDRNPESLVDEVLANFSETFDLNLPDITFQKAHRWLYALPEDPLKQGFIVDRKNQIGFCGDWCSGARVEGAFLSGESLANELVHYLDTEKTVELSKAKSHANK